MGKSKKTSNYLDYLQYYISISTEARKICLKLSPSETVSNNINTSKGFLIASQRNVLHISISINLQSPSYPSSALTIFEEEDHNFVIAIEMGMFFKMVITFFFRMKHCV